MSEQVSERIIQWVKKYNLKMDLNSFKECLPIEDRWDFENAIVSGFEDSTFWGANETGSPPSEYLPNYVTEYLSLVDDIKFKRKSVKSSDQWQTARIVLRDQGEEIEIILDDVNDSDWVPESLAIQMEKLTKERREKVLLTFTEENGFIVLYLPRDAYDEIIAIKKELPEPEEY